MYAYIVSWIFKIMTIMLLWPAEGWVIAVIVIVSVLAIAGIAVAIFFIVRHRKYYSSSADIFILVQESIYKTHICGLRWTIELIASGFSFISTELKMPWSLQLSLFHYRMRSYSVIVIDYLLSAAQRARHRGVHPTKTMKHSPYFRTSFRKFSRLTFLKNYVLTKLSDWPFWSLTHNL